ncbi:MAG: tryptophan 7-halogenase [Novosphingopyxis baekryungensis]|jgi:tryptophan halogenase|nr:tryptophan 7-halogenase [Novosphingopyxis baekryungensis]
MAISSIIIVGGGTAGWMTAAALSKLVGKRGLSVTLIESEQIGTVGVGEATIPPFINFNQLIGVEESDMLAAAKGSFKLGIQFSNWGQQGDSYFHPFGTYGYEIDGVSFHAIWQRMQAAGDKRPLAYFSPETMAAQFGRFAKTEGETRGDLPPINYAYHLDAGLYAAFLRKLAEGRGVLRREGKVADVSLHGENGHVRSVTLTDGSVIAGDLFVDCSGFRGLLIEQALETGYEDWSHWLPCDRAVAIPSAGNGTVAPYTRATARSAGWQWEVPLQHRNGNGHVYCSSHMEDDEALRILTDNIQGAALADPNFLRFTTGRRKKFWNRNVVALGLSAGFMEPLESTSIHLINTGISKLIALLSVDDITPVQADAFNRLTGKEYARIRDFLILHYCATKRDDSAFWTYCRTMSIPDSLSEKIELFRLNGQIFREEDELFAATSWVAVMMGQGIFPRGYSPMADALDDPNLPNEYNEIDKSIRHLIASMPEHRAFIDGFLEKR